MSQLKIYDLAAGIWRYVSSPSQMVAVSDSAPPSPHNGDLWWDTDDASLLVDTVAPSTLANDAAFTSKYAPISLGVLGVHTLTTVFTTVGTHTTFQDEGLTLTRNEIAGRRLKFTLEVNPMVVGVGNHVIYKLTRDGVDLRSWYVLSENLSGSYASANTLVYTDVSPATHIGSVFKVLIAGAGNTAVKSHADGTLPRQFIIEDVGT
jgi:hypothetical protein